MKPIPFPTKPEAKEPVASEMKQEALNASELNKQQPGKPELNRENPVQSELNKKAPEESELNKEVPEIVPKENCVYIDGKEIEIKPTKLKYFRNKMASSYSALKLIPLNELLTYPKGPLDEKRDGDQVFFDFLVAVFDDPNFVKAHYDDMTADDAERIIKIFGRLNHIDEKEEQQRKNREAQAQANR